MPKRSISTPRKPRIKESNIQTYVKESLELKGWVVVETHDAWHHPRTDGITDLIAVKYGFHVWIECKRPTWSRPARAISK